ncbi:MAG: ATP-binding cassette domain-containing protein [Oscillospiraceae bacterium]|nr:ATP-binding cassette domain-containing protein [Oscillospiraceae bacterium]
MVLNCKNVTKKYGRRLPIVLSIPSLDIIGGGFFAIVGQVGAGKSTLAEILAAESKPTTGECVFNGINIHKKRNKYSCGHVPQDMQAALSKQGRNFPPDWTLSRLLDELVGATPMSDGRIVDATYAKMMTRTVGLDEALGIPVAGFSVGMNKRLGIMLALWSVPDVVILDEPFTGLDPEIRENLTSHLGFLAKSRIVVMTTDIIEDVEAIASQVIVLKKGEMMFCGTAGEFTKETDGDMKAAYASYMDFEVTKV